MKKILIIAAAFITAFIITELIVSQVFNYPRAYSGTTYRINKNLKGHTILRIREPYCKILITEGKPQIFEFSNIGLPGPDIDTTIKEGFIYLLGNSFIEAMQVSKEEQAATQLQNLLRNNKYDNQVINLGVSAGDPYVMWFRANFFEKIYNPKKIVLVLESIKRVEKYLNSYDTLNFEIPNYFGETEPNSRIYDYTFAIRKHSRFLNLISRMIIENNEQGENSDSKTVIENKKNVAIIPKRLTECLKMFGHNYKEAFIIISIIPNSEENHELEKICDALKINFKFNNNLIRKENLINGAGHLNKKGNAELARFIFESLETK